METKRPREAVFVNVNDPNLKTKIKEMVILPNKDLHLTYVVWYKKDADEWGLTVKGFPDKSFGTQHTFKITWFHKEGLLCPASHCESQTSPIEGENFKVVEDIYLKAKEKRKS